MDVLKIGLIGGAGFLGYLWWKGLTPAVVGTVTPPASGTTVNTTTPPVTTTPVNTAAVTLSNKLLAITPAQMLIILGNAGIPVPSAITSLNVSQWNWYLTQATGIPGQYLGDDGSPITVIEYVNLLQAFAHAHSGMNGIGMLYNITDLYHDNADPHGFGDEEFLQRLSGIGQLVDAPANSAYYIDEGGLKLGATRNGSLDDSTRDFYLADGFTG